MISIIFLHFPFSNFVFEPIVLNSSRSTAVNYSRWYHLWQNGILTVFQQTRDGTGIEFIEYWNDIGSFSSSFRIESYRAAIMIVSIDLKVMTFFISPIFLLLLFPLLFLNYIFDFVESRFSSRTGDEEKGIFWSVASKQYRLVSTRSLITHKRLITLG